MWCINGVYMCSAVAWSICCTDHCVSCIMYIYSFELWRVAVCTLHDTVELLTNPVVVRQEWSLQSWFVFHIIAHPLSRFKSVQPRIYVYSKEMLPYCTIVVRAIYIIMLKTLNCNMPMTQLISFFPGAKKMMEDPGGIFRAHRATQKATSIFWCSFLAIFVLHISASFLDPINSSVWFGLSQNMKSRQAKSLMDKESLEHQQSESTIDFLRALKNDFTASSLSKEEFLPFFAIDNTASEEIASHSLVTHNLKSLTSLLTTENFRVFLSCVLFNTSCDEFLETFLTNRTRPCDMPSTPPPTISHAENLARLDYMVCWIYTPIVSVWCLCCGLKFPNWSSFYIIPMWYMVTKWWV